MPAIAKTVAAQPRLSADTTGQSSHNFAYEVEGYYENIDLLSPSQRNCYWLLFGKRILDPGANFLLESGKLFEVAFSGIDTQAQYEIGFIFEGDQQYWSSLTIEDGRAGTSFQIGNYLKQLKYRLRITKEETARYVPQDGWFTRMVIPAEGSTLCFYPDYSQRGTVLQGQHLSLIYEPSRIQNNFPVAGAQSPLQAASRPQSSKEANALIYQYSATITAYLVFDHRPPIQVAVLVTYPEGSFNLATARVCPTIIVPEDAKHLCMWFSSVTNNQIRYDSNLNANYHFEVKC